MAESRGEALAAHPYIDESREKFKSPCDELQSNVVKSLISCSDTSGTTPQVSPSVDGLGRFRRYRQSPVRGRKLPTQLVRSTGLLTHMGTPREEWALLSIACYLHDVTAENDSEAYTYQNAHTGTTHHVRREAGTHIKSIQGYAEDVRQRVYKKAARPRTRKPYKEWTSDFKRDYSRIRHALGRVKDYLQPLRAAVDSEKKPVRDRNGKVWQLSKELSGLPEASEQRPFVRCTGPEPEIDWEGLHIDVLDVLERTVAHRDKLYQHFTRGWKSCKHGSPHRRKHARKSHTWTCKRGADGPRYISVGRWRKDEIGQGDWEGRAVTVPWLIADIDGENWQDSGQHARRLCELLVEAGADPKSIVVSHTGNRSFHVRIPHGLLGCPVYATATDARESINRFFQRLCEKAPRLLDVIDSACFRPGQQIRQIGSLHENGNRVVATTADEFLEMSPIVLRAHSEVGQFSPYSLPRPEEAAFCSALHELLQPVGVDETSASGGEGKLLCCKATHKGAGEGVIERIKNGVHESEKWGRDVDRPHMVGRNWAAFVFALFKCQRSATARKDLVAWNAKCSPPLPRGELRTVYRHAQERANRSAPTARRTVLG